MPYQPVELFKVTRDDYNEYVIVNEGFFWNLYINLCTYYCFWNIYFTILNDFDLAFLVDCDFIFVYYIDGS